MKKYIIFLFILLPSIIFAQGKASLMPDISVVGDIQVGISSLEETQGEVSLDVAGIGLAFQGYLYPEIRSDVIIGIHKHGEETIFHLEEANISFLNIFENFNLKAGKMFINIGKINSKHTHAWDFIDRPLVLKNFFGSHSVMGEGVVVGWLIPLPIFANIEAGAYKISSAHSHEEGEEHEAEFSLADETYTLRVWTGFELAGGETEIGINGISARGSHYEHHEDSVKSVGVDVTYKYWGNNYERLIFQGEVYYIKRSVPPGDLERFGCFVFTGYRWDKYWDAGLRYGWSDNVFPVREKQSRISTMLTYSFTETTKLRTQYNYNIEEKYHEGKVQIVFGIGPHSHPLQ